MTNPMAEALQILEKLQRLGSTDQNTALRCRIILTQQKRKHAELVAQSLKCHKTTVYKWCRRWKKEIPKILEHWNYKDFNREKTIFDLLQDAPRSGSPPKYTQQQVTEIIALCCREPKEFGRPITHWTIPELADEVVKQGIADKVSERTLRRFLKSDRFTAAQKPLLAKSQN